MATLQEIRTVFLGTPGVAVTTCDALHAAGAQLVGVVTQPDKPAGRGRATQEAPVARRAAALGVPVFKPKGLKREENRRFLWDLKPDLLVVAAYGKILPKEVLDLPRFGAVNVHFSLLPRWRGPAPVPAALLAGDAETGVTIMKLDEGMDTGPILAQERMPIGPEDTTTSLLPRLAHIGARLLMATLERYLAGQLSPTPQDNAQATVCPMLKKEDGLIDWTKPATQIARMVRAYDPWPGTWTVWERKRLLIRKARLLATTDEEIASPRRPAGLAKTEPGMVRQLGGAIAVQTSDGLLALEVVQLEGRTQIPAAAFLHGSPQFVGRCMVTSKIRHPSGAGDG